MLLYVLKVPGSPRFEDYDRITGGKCPEEMGFTPRLSGPQREFNCQGDVKAWSFPQEARATLLQER